MNPAAVPARSFVVVGLEAGSMHAYKAGWLVSCSPGVVCGGHRDDFGVHWVIFVYHEAFITVNKLVVLVRALAGLFFLISCAAAFAAV